MTPPESGRDGLREAVEALAEFDMPFVVIPCWTPDQEASAVISHGAAKKVYRDELRRILAEHPDGGADEGTPTVRSAEGSTATTGDEEPTDVTGPDPGFASMCTACGRGLVSVGEWRCGGFTPAEPDAGEVEGLAEVIQRGLRKCRVEDAPNPLIRDHDLHHATHMVTAEVSAYLAAHVAKAKAFERERIAQAIIHAAAAGEVINAVARKPDPHLAGRPPCAVIGCCRNLDRPTTCDRTDRFTGDLDALSEAERMALAKAEFATWAGQGEGYGIEWADHLLTVVERILSDRLAPLLAERDEARAALEAGDACGAVGCRALAERDALLERVAEVVKTLEATTCGGECQAAEVAALILAALADPAGER
jgi:hypothetical protein